MKRVAVLSSRTPLGRALVHALERDPGVDEVRAVETRSPRSRARDNDAASEADVVPLVPDHRGFAAYLAEHGIDTVVQCDLLADRTGSSTVSTEADVISTMCLGAAIGAEGSTVRNWILVSSSAVYPVDSQAPLFQDEQTLLRPEGETVAASILEAEDYARDLASRLPYVNVAILRFQQLIGPESSGPLASVLAGSPAPTPIGFDPAIQFLHVDDAVSALTFAISRELAGVYNVTSSGSIRWQAAVAATDNGALPVLPIGFSPLEPLLRRLNVPVVPSELVPVLRFGHVIDGAKLERAGWRPRYDQADCLEALRGRG